MMENFDDWENIRPRKDDWDLRRAIQEKLDILEEKTEEALEILGKQIAESDQKQDEQASRTDG